MVLGIGLEQVDMGGFLGLTRDDILLPIASDDDYFTSATSGGSPGNFSVTSAVPGTSVFLSAQAAKPLFYGRRPQATMVDNTGGDLRMTLRITGRRFGRTVIQDISLVASATAVVGSRVIDEITDIKIISITAPAASDTVRVGFDDSWIGLQRPFKNRNSIKMVYKIANGTPDANGPKIRTDVTAAMVESKSSAIDVKTLFGAAIAVTDRYLVEYIANGDTKDLQLSGKRLG
jgi:hypothetical protein